MTPSELLDSLRALGATLSTTGDRLRADVHQGALTPELREALAEHKAALVALVRKPQEEGEPALST